MSLLPKFEERVGEIDAYFAFLKNIDEKKAKLVIEGKRNRSVTPTDDLLKILKANAYLLLYNLIESSIRSGLLAIYDSVKADGIAYPKLIQELQRAWLDNVLPSANDRTPESTSAQVFDILEKVVSAQGVTFDARKLKIAGNVDAQRVRWLSDAHGFSHATQRVRGGEKLVNVKKQRNDLAHGLTSFIECGRNVTSGDLELIRKQVVSFMRQILRNIDRFIAKKKYVRS